MDRGSTAAATVYAVTGLRGEQVALARPAVLVEDHMKTEACTACETPPSPRYASHPWTGNAPRPKAA
ncbi:hypothetical protein [Streptomyces sp. NBC_00454]|uniref:hypothetical protein n=1 Tax=Streptomyces sp. NBC_00454 TaxID=2975747 RepID=UPI0030E3F93E